MSNSTRPITILIADDDADDRMIASEALEESRLANDLRFVEDGEELLDYLHRRGKYAAPGAAPWPGLILLDPAMLPACEALPDSCPVALLPPELCRWRGIHVPRGARLLLEHYVRHARVCAAAL